MTEFQKKCRHSRIYVDLSCGCYLDTKSVGKLALRVNYSCGCYLDTKSVGKLALRVNY